MTTTKERPILFSAPMVRAILDGTKTQTRRVIKPQSLGRQDARETGGLFVDIPPGGAPRSIECPFGRVRDRLWVRETWLMGARVGHGDTVQEKVLDGPIPKQPPADEFDFFTDYAADSADGDGPWRPSIHMPRWASRITLEVTGVRVERLGSITEEDARAEGVEQVEIRRVDGGEVAARLSYRDSFERLWRDVYSPESWAANPWVWVVSFKVVPHV